MSTPPDGREVLEKWSAELERLLKQCRVPQDVLKGVSVRVRHSRRPEIRPLGEAFASVLRMSGADLKTIEDIDYAMKSALPHRELDGIDAFVMIAATTGVSGEALELAHEKTRHNGPFKDRLFVAMPKIFDGGFISKRLVHHGVYLDHYEQGDVDTGRLGSRVVGKLIERKRLRDTVEETEKRTFEPRIGIVTALPKEFNAMISLLDNKDRQRHRPSAGSIAEYVHGTIPAPDGNVHKVVVVKAGVGNNYAALMSERLLKEFELDEVFMVGIAGGLPRVSPADEDVRLGDVVVSGRGGVVQYDMKKRKGSKDVANHPPRAPSDAWRQLAESMVADREEMTKFNARLAEGLKAAGSKRPPASTDVLTDDAKPTPNKIARKPDPNRKKFASLAFSGAIGSANMVLKDHASRERLRKKHGILAVEMEGSGVSDAAQANATPFFIVRGICDYANTGKNDRWHDYAAMAAAAFTACLIGSMPIVQKRDG